MMSPFAVVIAAVFILVGAAFAVSANRTLARGAGGKRRISDTDAAENAYLESRLAGYNPDGTLSDPDALHSLAEEENSR